MTKVRPSNTIWQALRTLERGRDVAKLAAGHDMGHDDAGSVQLAWRMTPPS